MKIQLVIDGNSIINRAFYGISPLTASDGLHTNAIYGLINTVYSQINSVKPDYVTAAFDLKAPTFRHKMFDAYKAGRRPTPPELLEQFPYAKECLSAMGIYVAEKEGYEADDILGTLAYQGEKAGDVKTFLLTGDRDSLQLIDKNTVVLLATNKETVYFDENAFLSHYGVSSDRFVDVKALMGDSSDNIPGVAGIGEKTALKLISEHGSIDGLYENIDTAKLTPSVLSKLKAGKDSAYLSRELARINRESPIGFTYEDTKYNGIKEGELYSLFNRLGFSRMIEKMNLKEIVSEASFAEKEKEVIDEKGLSSLGEEIYVLSENDGLSILSNGKRYIYSGDLKATEPCFNERRIITHDLKGLMHLLSYEINNCVFDTMLAAYVDRPGEGDYSLRALSAVYQGDGGDTLDYLLYLHKHLCEKLDKSGELSLLIDIEIPTAVVLYNMEKDGFKVDTNGLAAFGEELDSIASGLEAKIYEAAGRKFNINSPKQLGVVLFEEMQLPPPKKTKTGYSTASDVLSKLEPYYPIIHDILEYRHVTKLKSTFVVGLLKAADGDCRVHTSFNQCVTATGRLSSTEPNLQNIPIRTELGARLRGFFIPKNGEYTLVDADYSQIELRLLAHIAKDENMCRAFKNGEDIHTSTASAVFGTPMNEVTAEQRKRAKAVNFGIVYGIGAFSLAQDLNIPQAAAKKYIADYLDNFSGVAAYLTGCVEEAYKNGYVTTVFGRRREIPELKSSNGMLRKFGERVAMNSPIQGSAADIIKVAMVSVTRRLKNECPEARLILQVHDELLLEVPKSRAKEAAAILSEEMERAAELSVPLPADCGIGDTWLIAKE